MQTARNENLVDEMNVLLENIDQVKLSDRLLAWKKAMQDTKPKICTEIGFSAGSLSMSCFVFWDPYTSPFELIISEHTNPQPASLANKRMGRLVIPAKGANIVKCFNLMEPI